MIEQILSIKENTLENIDLNLVVDGIQVSLNGFLVSESGTYLNDRPGSQPYKLYAFLSTLFNDSVILDVGSQYGASALSLSYNQTNKVVSYDIVDFGVSEIKKSNIEWKVMDFRDDETIDYEKVKMIVIDVDPHDGIQEKEMIEFLMEKKWSGVLIFDDIHKDNSMNQFWDSLCFENKIDVTHVAHVTGTGIIIL